MLLTLKVYIVYNIKVATLYSCLNLYNTLTPRFVWLLLLLLVSVLDKLKALTYEQTLTLVMHEEIFIMFWLGDWRFEYCFLRQGRWSTKIHFLNKTQSRHDAPVSSAWDPISISESLNNGLPYTYSIQSFYGNQLHCIFFHTH